MTNTLTISRELAERLCPIAFAPSDPDVWRAREELRALLAAPVVERQGRPAEFRYRFTHHGELSKWFPVDSYRKLATIANDPAYEIQPLYTSPPAPVAVVLPARGKAKGLYANGWNACLGKVKELNQ